MSYRLRRDGDVLRLRPTLTSRIFSLFLSDRRVDVDGRRRRIVIEDRVLGFLRSRREIPFDRVDSLEYDCEVRESSMGAIPSRSSPWRSFSTAGSAPAGG